MKLDRAAKPLAAAVLKNEMIVPVGVCENLVLNQTNTDDRFERIECVLPVAFSDHAAKFCERIILESFFDEFIRFALHFEDDDAAAMLIPINDVVQTGAAFHDETGQFVSDKRERLERLRLAEQDADRFSGEETVRPERDFEPVIAQKWNQPGRIMIAFRQFGEDEVFHADVLSFNRARLLRVIDYSKWTFYIRIINKNSVSQCVQELDNQLFIVGFKAAPGAVSI